MTDTLRSYDLIPEVDATLNEKARRVVAGYPTTDVESTRDILDALGLLSSTPVSNPVDKRATA